jgi:hypothetical protein
MNDSENRDNLSELLSEYRPKFRSGFSNRVISKLEAGKLRIEEDSDLYAPFRWVAISGIAAIVLLLFTVYFTDGYINTDAIFGILNYSPDEPLLSSLDF